MTPNDPASPAADAHVPVTPFSSLGMYPLEWLRPAWEQLYSRAAREVLGAPNEMVWAEPQATWMSRQLVVGMTCGWPLVSRLQRRVRVLGTFEYATGDMSSHMYQSVIIARDPQLLATLTGGTAAINSVDSLSGHLSLLSALSRNSPSMPATLAWPGAVLFTGSHSASLAAVREGTADVASIDALTWAYIGRHEPDSLDGLVVVDRGPLVPGLPLIVNRDTSAEAIADWRTAFATTVHDPALREVMATLSITGFVALDFADYESALHRAFGADLYTALLNTTTT